MRTFILFLAVFMGFLPIALANEATKQYDLVIQDQSFAPQKLEVPAGQPFQLIVKNTSSKTAEFESNDFKREKILKPGQIATIRVGALPAGNYKFFDEFNENNQGTLVVK